jgi:hypothetical protein
VSLDLEGFRVRETIETEGAVEAVIETRAGARGAVPAAATGSRRARAAGTGCSGTSLSGASPCT